MTEETTFEKYLISKNIDFAKLKMAESKLYRDLESQYQEMHPASFTAQKLFLINPLRRKYKIA